MTLPSSLEDWWHAEQRLGDDQKQLNHGLFLLSLNIDYRASVLDFFPYFSIV